MKIGWVKKTDDAKSRRGMNKGTGFGPKNKPSLLSNGRGEGELAGSKKRYRGTESCVHNTGRKQCKDTDMFLYFGFSVFCAMSKVQCENFHLSLKKNSANI